jgi:hypothetical protein
MPSSRPLVYRRVQKSRGPARVVSAYVYKLKQKLSLSTKAQLLVPKQARKGTFCADIYLHIDELNRSTITRRDNMDNINMPTIAIPWWAILKDLSNLKGNTLGDVSCLQKLQKGKTNDNQHTFVGSRLTRPQARAATPLQLCETAMIPTESGPGCDQYHNWNG